MPTPRDLTATDPLPLALGLVLAPHAWAWGWGDPQAFKACTESVWPEGEPPLTFPAELLRPTLQRAFQDLPLPIGVHVRCASWGRDSAPDWWPHHKAGVRQWQQWLATQGGQLQSVAQAQADLGMGDLNTWVQQSRWQGVHKPAALTDAAPSKPQPWHLLALSGLAALVVHALMVGVVQPWWGGWREQARAQAERQRQQDIAHQAEATAQSRRAEQAAHTQLWRQEQQAAWRPLQDLGRWLQQLGPEPPPQLWLELRQAKGSWTVLGVASHPMPLHELLRVDAPHEPVLIQSIASTWPPEPALGWPAWRFEWQTPETDQAPTPEQPASPAKADGSTDPRPKTESAGLTRP
jgi:hypothetical protein